MKKITVIALTFLLISCGSYTITKQSFIEQIEKNSSVSRSQNVSSLGTGYDSNKLDKISCYDKNGKEVTINPNKNTTFSITNSKTGEKMNLYYDTVYILNDTLIGLKSRILGGKKKIALQDIAAIIVKTEN